MIIATIVVFYLVGVVLSYLKAKSNALKIYKKWTVGHRFVVMLFSCLSWIFYLIIAIESMDLDKPAKW